MILGPLLLKYYHFQLYLFRRMRSSCLDRIHPRLDLTAYFVPPDFVAMTKETQGFPYNLTGSFVFAHGNFLANKLLHGLG